MLTDQPFTLAASDNDSDQSANKVEHLPVELESQQVDQVNRLADQGHLPVNSGNQTRESQQQPYL